MKNKKGGKSVIVKDVMAKGVTARKAEAAVKAVFDRMTLALCSGEKVEIPGGSIQAKLRKGKRCLKWQKFRNVHTDKTESKWTWYPGHHLVVKFTPDLELDVSPFPAPEAPELMEARQLATYLLKGKPAREEIMRTLQQAVEKRPHKPGALLRRLRELKSNGYLFDNDGTLASSLYNLYWI
ncbi:MAG: HU family DNA-binding protein [Candidatus Solibacter sp.]